MSEGPDAASTGWFDSHCHLHDEEQPIELFERARRAGVGHVILIGTDAVSSRRASEVAAGLGDGAWSSVGLHPHDAAQGVASLAPQLDALGENPPPRSPGSVVAIGECGLDYYYEHSPRDAQQRAFVEQIALAKALDLTLVVHTRDAWDDTLAILSGEGIPERTVIHCFTGGVDEARACLELGAFLSFSGIVTFKNAAGVRAAAQFCPVDRMLVETDAPYLAPVPHRGERNEPAYVAVVGEAVAELREVAPAALLAATAANTIEAFDLAQ